MVMAEVIFLHDSTVDRLEFGDVEDFSLFTIIESTLFLTAYTTHTHALRTYMDLRPTNDILTDLRHTNLRPTDTILILVGILTQFSFL